ncbi:MAG: hypoxanthine phosphoribosyltransferase [Catonella sp.]|nr:hypoxanthine phosphoribosyltransferase [Catonella sp.]MDY6356482.1 hypoxanthine phosphoribosyltransferase [Catonella sp.]
MDEKINVLIDEDRLCDRIKEMAEKINRDYAGKSLHIIGVLKGSVFMMTELAKHITVPVTMDFMCVSSYGNGTESTGRVKIVKDLDEGIAGRDVLIVEDIIDSGNTLHYLQKVLEERKPASLKLCTLLDKPERRVVDDVTVDYVGFEIPDKFVVGFGLDYAQKYRNLPYIGVIGE